MHDDPHYDPLDDPDPPEDPFLIARQVDALLEELRARRPPEPAPRPGPSAEDPFSSSSLANAVFG